MISLRIVEEFTARGHPNIVAKHRTTFEITKEHWLTERGDCVVAVQATKGLADLSTEFKKLCVNDETVIVIELQAAGMGEFIEGKGSRRLTLNHPSDIVGRKSAYTSDRTIMIHADKAACDVNKALVSALTARSVNVKIRITAEL